MSAYPGLLAPADIFKTLRESVNSLITEVQALVIGGAFVSLSLDAGNITTIGSTTQALIIGDAASTNIIFDSNEIQARNNGVLNDFHINRFGGSVVIGQDVPADLHVSQDIYENAVALSAKYLGIGATTADSTLLGSVAAADYALATGDNIIGNFDFNNAITISAQKLDTTSLDVLYMDATDVYNVGNIAVPLALRSSIDGIINIAGTPQTLVHTGNVNDLPNGINLAVLFYIGGL